MEHLVGIISSAALLIAIEIPKLIVKQMFRVKKDGHAFFAIQEQITNLAKSGKVFIVEHFLY